MFSREITYKKIPLLLLLLAVVLFILSAGGGNAGDHSQRVAHNTEKRIVNRARLLERYVTQLVNNPLESDRVELPEDMVIYRYVNDSLASWNNQFPIVNDDISTRMMIQRLTNFRVRLVSPLTRATDEFSYVNLGPKWFMIKEVPGNDNDKFIAGLEIKNTLIDDLRKTENGVNPRFLLPGRYSIQPINNNGGSEVTIDGKPMFKIICDNSAAMLFIDNSIFRWSALLLLAMAIIMILAFQRTIKTYILAVITLAILSFTAYLWGIQARGNILFSPSTYANGSFLFSLGALIIVNTYITLFCVCTYIINGKITDWIRHDRKRMKKGLVIHGLSLILVAIFISVYTHLTLKSIIFNSNINLEIYRISEGDDILLTILVYASYTMLLSCLLLQIQMLRPAARELFGIKYDIYAPKTLAAFAFILALYFSVTAETYGFQKEQRRVQVWANMLAVERDLGIEIQLRSVESAIASDQLISALANLENSGSLILSRIKEYYLPRIKQEYSMSITVIKDTDKEAERRFNDILNNGTAISNGSHFMFVTDSNGRSRYTGVFMYYTSGKGVTRLLLEIVPNTNREDRGYYSLLGQLSHSQGVNIPTLYSYAKYIDSKLTLFTGSYPYPTIYDNVLASELENKSSSVARRGHYAHFTHKVSDDEYIVISRPQRNFLVYFTSFSYLFLLLSGILLLFARSRKQSTFRSNYFRTRINTILLTSSLLILVSMAVVSIVFVYKRNEVNMHNLMSSKISTVQALTESRVRNARSWRDLTSPEFGVAMENISNTTKSDITFYTPEGKVFRSTTPEVFEKMILGSRINQAAYYNICKQNQRYYIHREKLADFSYWALYAPIFNDNQQMIAIACIPYTDKNYDFRREAFFHASLIINLFLLLLIASLIFSSKEVNSMFAPLEEMGKKMNSADIHNLEYIIYKRQDEISSLVDAYNRMVHDLSESTQQLALAERDKAWSQMARQVAHEIKNPLTPIKLEIQRLIRLKQKGNPSWEEKFDKVSAVVLEHIDILTETANEFSTFAKLYTEEPVVMDLDKTLKDQMLIFDNRANIKMQYIGMPEAFVKAPKPQLIRVFVNLLTNAIQAVEIMQKEALERGEEMPAGRVMICLRKSTLDGYYDVVFDDNGAGVSDENMHKLFTPNFTTKSGGTGLGLAICRNIIEKCEGEIRYQKSFALGGASFIVSLPVYIPEE